MVTTFQCPTPTMTAGLLWSLSTVVLAPAPATCGSADAMGAVPRAIARTAPTSKADNAPPRSEGHLSLSNEIALFRLLIHRASWRLGFLAWLSRADSLILTPPFAGLEASRR